MMHITLNIKSRSPLLMMAIHNGHEVRQDVEEFLAIDEMTRMREEDPYTNYFTRIAENNMVIDTSRFEVDINRPIEKAIYKTPEHAWGLKVWKDEVPDYVWSKSLSEYHFFYSVFESLIKEFIENNDFVVIYDIHTYNYRRDDLVNTGEPLSNPEINVGTQNINRKIWGPVIHTFIRKMRAYDYFGRHLDVRENVKFKGGYLSEWIKRNYPDQVCLLAIEVKKIFMDEWTGAVDISQLREISNALKSTLAGVSSIAGEINEDIQNRLSYFRRTNELVRRSKRMEKRRQ